MNPAPEAAEDSVTTPKRNLIKLEWAPLMNSVAPFVHRRDFD
jgi:hypothetical protein